MKYLLKSFNPKHLFSIPNPNPNPKSKSKSAPSSFGSYYSSTSSSSSSDESSKSAPLSCDSFDFDYIQAFKILDRDGDGKISLLELQSLLRRLRGKSPPPTSEEVAAMIGDIDRDGDGCISLDELRAVGSAFDSTVSGEDELTEVFDIFDADHDGKISAEELLEVFLALGDDRCTLEDCQRMIAGVDKNGDGFVCFEDFTRMMDLHRS